jgi:hypothetical protein
MRSKHTTPTPDPEKKRLAKATTKKASRSKISNKEEEKVAHVDPRSLDLSPDRVSLSLIST